MGSHCRGSPAPFLTKTYEMVDDASSDEVISWNESGSAFVVWSPADFAKDLLPRYFKHNNFSSFVRQLNTYGFRKVASDRWEFRNELFRRGDRELLYNIYRRKSTSSSHPAAQKQNDGPPSPSSNSYEDQHSSFTSSDPKSSIKNQLSDIFEENEKLRKDNTVLASELAEARRQSEGLVAFLCKCFNVEIEKINTIIQGGGDLKSEQLLQLTKRGGVGGGEEEEGRAEEGMKLFGVWLKNNEKTKKKRGCEDGEEGLVVRPFKEMKMVDCRAPWMKTCPSSIGESNKVCN